MLFWGNLYLKQTWHDFKYRTFRSMIGFTTSNHSSGFSAGLAAFTSSLCYHKVHTMEPILTTIGKGGLDCHTRFYENG